MLVKALVDYYDILEEKGEVPVDGFCKQKIHFKILLNPEGGIDDIVDCRKVIKTEDKNGKIKITYEPIIEDYPNRNQKPGIASEILDHRPKYIFGMSFDQTGLVLSTDKKSGTSIFEVFKETNLEFIKDIDSTLAISYKKFIENWHPENELENEALNKIGKDFDKWNYCFAMSGNPKLLLNRDKAVKDKWKARYDNKASAEALGTCSVTGERNVEIARIHSNKIKGIVGGQASGCVLIGTNNPAEESYGKTQAYNSGISEKTVEKYTTALNYLTSDRRHKMTIDDMTIVFWACDINDDKCSEIFELSLGEDIGSDGINEEIGQIFKSLKEGKKADIDSLDIDKEVDFYVVGITPNNSRLSLRFVYRNTFGNMLDGIYKHCRDMMLKETAKQSSLWMIKKELVSPKSSNAKVPASITTNLFKAILFGYKYPTALFETVIRRIKTDKYENPVRIGILKAYINRNNGRDEIKMGLDMNNTNSAYLCGRLFALLEYVQCRAAAPAKLNRTIKDAYFSAACGNPSKVFPKILKLSEHHTAKLDNSVWADKLKGEIILNLNSEFPGTLNLTEQGTFIIGYYQQKQNFYTKKEEENKNEGN